MWEVEQYIPLIERIVYGGEKRQTRAGGAWSIFGETMSIDVGKEFPLLHGRKMYYKPVLGELAAMMRGPKRIADFKHFGCNYWDEWGDAGGNINVDYGNAWIDFNGENQLKQVIQKLKTSPTDRRILISAWRPDRLSELSLPCCHLLYQWYVRDGKYLDMIWYQRSVDVMVGLPSDIILAAAWNIALATECDYKPGVIKIWMGDTHIYENHSYPMMAYVKQARELYAEGRKPTSYTVNSLLSTEAFVPDDIMVIGYTPASYIKFELNVGPKQ